VTTTSKTRAVVLLGAAFSIGLTVGALAMAVANREQDGRRHDSSCTVRSGRVCFWAGMLQLTSDQQDSLVKIYRSSESATDSIHGTIRPAMDSIYQTIRPRVDSQRTILREEVRSILTPIQREKYDSTTHAYDEERRRGRDGNNKGNGGPPRGRP